MSESPKDQDQESKKVEEESAKTPYESIIEKAESDHAAQESSAASTDPLIQDEGRDALLDAQQSQHSQRKEDLEGFEMDAYSPSGSRMPIFTLVFLLISISLGFSISNRTVVKTSGQEEVDLSSLSGVLGGSSDKDGIAVVRLYGAIQTSSDQGVFGAQKGSDAIVKQLKDLGENERVKALVLRINSPGGTVGASQEIHSELMKLKKKGIKIVASMADVCASGGVYAAVAADKILANKGTITGSVGVIFSVSNLSELFKKVGISQNAIRSGKFKDIGSMSRDMTEEEEKLLQEIVDSTYQQFLDAVATGRGLEKEDVKKWADGRIFNGEQALEYKLVDQLGTYEDALEVAQKLAGLDEINIIKPKVNPFDRFGLMLQNYFNPLQKIKEEVLHSEAPLLYLYRP